MTPFCGAVDWGTSSFRLWLLDETGGVLGESRGPEGMMHCAATGFEPVLREHLQRAGAPADLPVVVCGMAGARQGWLEASYLPTPARLDSLGQAAIRVPTDIGDVRILPGIAQRDPTAPDVMRGEETQLIGAASGSGLYCLPGTHCKWVMLERGAVERFTTFMTGELFAVLATHSILRHAADEGAAVEPGPAFLGALEQAAAHPERKSSALFSIRAGQLLGFSEKADGAAQLSGLLVGAELAAVRRLHGAATAVTLVASGRIAALYQTALQASGYSVTMVDAETAVRRGLFAAARQIWSGDR